MSPQENIKDELNLLGASLPYPAKGAGYEVPAGYFEGFADSVMNRIRQREELEQVSPFLNSLSREMPYSTPPNYFDSLQIPAPTNEEEISSLLIGLKDKPTYQVPENYFDQLPGKLLQQVQSVRTAKVVSLGRSWFRYAAAAVLTGIALTAGLLIYNAQRPVGSVAWVEKNTRKVSTDEINSLIELAKVDSTTSIVQSTAAEDVKSLVKDISDKEIQDFLKDTDLDEKGTDDELFLN